MTAVAHSLLVMAYFRIKTGEAYRETGGDSFERIKAEGLKHYLIQKLERLGQRVILEPIPNRA